MSRSDKIRKHQLGLLFLLLLGGLTKATVGVLLFFRQPLTTAAIAALLAFAVSFTASRIFQSHASDAELLRIAEILGLVGSIIYGLILLGLLLTDWRNAAGFTVFLLLTSPRLLAHISGSKRSAAPSETF